MELIHKLGNTAKLIGIETPDALCEAQANVLWGEAAVAERMKN